MNENAVCRHFWYLETAQGRSKSPGRCILCGAVKFFANSFDTRLGASFAAPQTTRGTAAAHAAKRKAKTAAVK